MARRYSRCCLSLAITTVYVFSTVSLLIFRISRSLPINTVCRRETMFRKSHVTRSLHLAIIYVFLPFTVWEKKPVCLTYKLFGHYCTSFKKIIIIPRLTPSLCKRKLFLIYQFSLRSALVYFLDTPVLNFRNKENNNFSGVVSPRGTLFVFIILFYYAPFGRNRGGTGIFLYYTHANFAGSRKELFPVSQQKADIVKLCSILPLT
jgi:hypothetical protein